MLQRTKQFNSEVYVTFIAKILHLKVGAIKPELKGREESQQELIPHRLNLSGTTTVVVRNPITTKYKRGHKHVGEEVVKQRT